jgi:hypothetical protein
MHILGPGIRGENRKTSKENETQTRFDMEYGDKQSKR